MRSFPKIKESFKRLIEKNALSHAYLLFGGGAGSVEARRGLARGIAEVLERVKVESESEKKSGRSLASFDKAQDESGRPLSEFLEITPDEKGTIGIDAVRAIAGFLQMKPVFSSRRTVFIDEAEAVTPEAQNALLKIVEEPPVWSLIFLSAHTVENVLPTLQSRLQKIFVPSGKIQGGTRGGDGKGILQTLHGLIAQKEIADHDIDSFFERALGELDKKPLDNVEYIKAVLSRLLAIKTLNTNTRLQLRALDEAMRGYAD
ncbi:hypothetical protein HY504_00915 [Candidatus Wolfebacteria bacterium]|nr:hypothetical protein [Candidatus Wolfebacteria bacterium]